MDKYSGSDNSLHPLFQAFVDRVFGTVLFCFWLCRRFQKLLYQFFCFPDTQLFIKKNLQLVYSKYGVEKYDAFDDVGGKLSFALAMLDKDNTGLILNAVHSRDNCFLYLKEIVKGESYVMLSQEEVEALRKAVNFGLGELEDLESE